MHHLTTPIAVALAFAFPATVLLAWALAVYRLKLLMRATGVVLLVIGTLMLIPVLDRLLAPLALRIVKWIGREIEEHG